MEYYKDLHLSQVYSGFFELQKKGIVDLKIKATKKTSSFIPLITVSVNQKKVIYDVLDGLTWIPGPMDKNLEYFRSNFSADFFFKRSFHRKMLEYRPAGCHVYPLGLNYSIQPSTNMFSLSEGLKEKIKYTLKTNRQLRTIFKKKFAYAADFEYYPTKHDANRILFMTRLWDPGEAKSEASKYHREHINNVRVQCIEACRKEFGKYFTGGLSKTGYTQERYKSLLVPQQLTNKFNYLNAVKEHSICIATTGLHDSIGWKMAEYVAASRAIVSEPLHFELPGNFEKDVNYLEFEHVDQLVSKLQTLLQSQKTVLQMMESNFRYYNNFLKPENMIFNTLLTVMHNS
jgi:hypothetical protein